MKLLRGQTLIEMLIAFMVIAVGLFAAASIVYSNLGLVQRDQDEVTATNLAREGVEMAKQLRDSNWLAPAAPLGSPTDGFDAGFYSGTDYSATPVWNPLAVGGTVPSFNFVANDFSTDNTKIVLTQQGVLVNADSSLGLTNPAKTPFRRILTFNPICANYSVKSSGTACDVSTGAKIGIRVKSDVQWVRAGQTKDFIVYDDLYDWR